MGLGASVEEGDRTVSVGQRLDPYVAVALPRDPGTLHAERILIDGEDVRVGKHVDRLLGQAAHIAADDQRRRDHRPHGELRA